MRLNHAQSDGSASGLEQTFNQINPVNQVVHDLRLQIDTVEGKFCAASLLRSHPYWHTYRLNVANQNGDAAKLSIVSLTVTP